MTTGAVEHSRAMSPAGGGGQNRHQPAQEVAVQPDIPGADAVADQRRSQLRDALSVGTIVTDQHHWSTAKIYETYKARWAIENFLNESNQSFSSGKLPSSRFRGNQFFLALLVVVYNLMQWFKRDCLPRAYRAVSFGLVRRHFLEHAVVIEERGEQEIHLIFNEDYPLQRAANFLLRKAVAA